MASMSSLTNDPFAYANAINADLRWFESHLNVKQADNLTTIVKGQLLIEGIVRQTVAAKVKNPTHLESFKAADIVATARALGLFDDWIGEACVKINQLRNQYAHALVPTEKAERFKFHTLAFRPSDY